MGLISSRVFDFKSFQNLNRHVQKNTIYYIIVFFWLVYARTLFFGYIADDFALVPLSFKEAADWAFDFYIFRPLCYFSFPFFGYFSTSSVFQHLLNLILFTISIYLAYKVCMSYKVGQLTSSLVVLIWTLIPWNAFNATWISQRHYILMNIFVLASLLLFNRTKYIHSVASYLMACLFNVSCALLGIYYWFCLFLKKKTKILIFFSSCLLIYGLCMIIAMVANKTKTAGPIYNYTSSPVFILLGHTWFFFEGIATQLVPAPFFVNYWHTGLYLLFLFLFLFSVKFQWNKLKDNVGIIIIFLLVMIPAFRRPVLSVHTFPSFILILIISQIIQIKHKRLFNIAIFTLIIFYLGSIYVTQNNFNTGICNLSFPKHGTSKDAYPSAYYQLRKKMLLHVFEKLTHQFLNPSQKRDKRELYNGPQNLDNRLSSPYNKVGGAR